MLATWLSWIAILEIHYVPPKQLKSEDVQHKKREKKENPNSILYIMAAHNPRSFTHILGK